MEPHIYEIDLNKKYFLMLSAGTPYEEYNRLREYIAKWLDSDKPFFFAHL